MLFFEVWKIVLALPCSLHRKLSTKSKKIFLSVFERSYTESQKINSTFSIHDYVRPERNEI